MPSGHKKTLPISELLAPALFKSLGGHFEHGYFEVCAQDFVKDNRLTLTVTVVVTECEATPHSIFGVLQREDLCQPSALNFSRSRSHLS